MRKTTTTMMMMMMTRGRRRRRRTERRKRILKSGRGSPGYHRDLPVRLFFCISLISYTRVNQMYVYIYMLIHRC